MAHKSDRDAFLIDIQTTEISNSRRNKVLLFHPKASSVQRLLSHPLYAFARPWSRSQHPSYKSQVGARRTDSDVLVSITIYPRHSCSWNISLSGPETRSKGGGRDSTIFVRTRSEA